MSHSPLPGIALSRRLRSTPFTGRILEQGVSAFTVYNHMLLPTTFVSPEADYWHLCTAVQVWDVGVERQVSIRGPDATRLVQWMTPRNVQSVAAGRCVYLPLVDKDGGLVNDPVGLCLGDDHWWLSVADSDVLLWARGLAVGAGLDVVVTEPDVWPLAVQGPQAETLMSRVFGESVRDIRFFRFRLLEFEEHPFLVARSGWSKQGGFEIYVDDVPNGQALYDALFAAGQDLDVRPGCPNSIERVESSLFSYGNDFDSRHTPQEAGLGAFINLDAEVDALGMERMRARAAAGVKRRMRGLSLPAPDGARPFAARPFDHLLETGSKAVDTGDAPERYPVPDASDFIGSQAWSPRYRHQLAFVMVDEPLASNETPVVQLASGELTQARLSDLPFDFAALGIVDTSVSS